MRNSACKVRDPSPSPFKFPRSDSNVLDWDDPPGAIDWPRMRSALAHVKQAGKLPESHYSHDHLNAQTEVPLPLGMTDFWTERFTGVVARKKNEDQEDIKWAILDGFLLYYDPVRSIGRSISLPRTQTILNRKSGRIWTCG